MAVPPDLVAALRGGDRALLARVLTLIESGGSEAETALRAIPIGAADDAHTVGITGAPGSGKSTLADALVASIRAPGSPSGLARPGRERVAVLAVDPSSPVSGGAILGDRVRMPRHTTDANVFIRSMATRGHLGGTARATPQAIRVLGVAGFAWILVETVGVGQVEVEIARGADTTVVVVNPGWGDSVQASKAGLLEIGDVFVVNKADREGAEATVRDLEAMAARSGARSWIAPVVRTIAIDGEGVDALHAMLLAHWRHLVASGELLERRERRIADEVRALVLDRAMARADVACRGEGFATVVKDVADGSLDPYTAATVLGGGADRGDG